MLFTCNSTIFWQSKKSSNGKSFNGSELHIEFFIHCKTTQKMQFRLEISNVAVKKNSPWKGVVATTVT